MSDDVKSVSLREVEGVEDIKFLRAEWKHEASPFVLVRYEKDGREQPDGLSLDLDKRIFLVRDEVLNMKVCSRTEEIWQTIINKRGLALV
jgi:hypothetical protein